MKPLTRAEADVLALSAHLPEVDDRRFYDVLSDLWVSSADDIGYNCYDMNCRGMTYLNQCYVLVFQSVKGFQVIRRYICETRTRIPSYGYAQRYSEVSQLWITPRGEKVELRKPRTWARRVAGWRHDYWATGGRMRAILGDIDIESYIYRDEPSQGESETIFVDSIAKNAIKVLASMEFNQTIMEKIDDKISEYAGDIDSDWGISKKAAAKGLHLTYIYPSITIARRHGYPLAENIDRWLDLMAIMQKVDGADMQNPVYICPTHIEDCIKYFTRKYEKQEAKKEAERQAELARQQEKDDMAYKEKMQKYLCIAFDTDTLKFHVLQDVNEFFEEAKAMHHCVYKRKYYQKYSSLILSCTDKRTGRRVSTIEIDLKTMKVLQNYAACDKIPAKDKEIRQAIEDNINLIRNAS